MVLLLLEPKVVFHMRYYNERELKLSALLLQTDVTANDEEDQAMLKRFGLFGPPAVLFFGPDGRERRGYRVIGFMRAKRFKVHAQQALS